MDRRLLIAAVLLTAACSNSSSPTSPSDPSGEYLADAASDTAAFLNVYEVDPSISLVFDYRFRVYKPAEGMIAVDYLDRSAPSSGVNVVSLTTAGEDVSAGDPLGYTDLDDVPERWFGHRFPDMVRLTEGSYLRIGTSAAKIVAWTYDAGGPAGAPVDTAVVFDLATSDLAGSAYQVQLPSPLPVARTAAGAVTAIFLNSTGGAFPDRIRLIWLDGSLSVVQTADFDRSFVGESVVLLATSDGGVVVGSERPNGTFALQRTAATDGDSYVFKLDASGDFQWESFITWNNTKREEPIRIVEAPNGNLLVASRIQSSTYYSSAMSAADFAGRITEFSPFGGALRTVLLPIPVHNVWDISPRANGKYLVVGTLYSTYYNKAALFVANLNTALAFTRSNVTP